MLTFPSRIVCSIIFWYSFISASLLSFESKAQTKLSDIKLTVGISNAPLSELLEQISKKSNIPFSYNPKKIPSDQKIDYQATNKSLPSILDELSEKFGLKYMMVENQIILKPEKKNEKTTASPILTFSGNIKDKNTGEALIGATLFVKELQTGTVTNPFGFFSMTLPKGSYTITCSFISYKELTTTLDLATSIKQDIKLTEEPPILKEIIVSSTTIPDVINQIQVSNTHISATTVEERPALLGEMDVVKSLESVPGVKFHSDGSTFYYVRGGNRDQNMILIDDAPIYNPSHMLGIFSTIIPDAVNSMTLYKGDMPASLGGRLSSVLDVRTKKGNDQHLQIWGSSGLISTKLGVEGPIKKGASSYLVSARLSSLKWLFKMADKNLEKFNFFDLTGKVNFRLNKSNRLFFSSYTGGDNYYSNNNAIAWNNTAGTLRWNHLFTERLFLNSTLSLASYDYNLYTDVANNTRWTSHISNLNLKTDFSYFIKPQNELTFGWSINLYNFNPGNLKSNLDITTLPTLSVKNSAEYVLYGNHELKITDKLGVNYGARLSMWINNGESFEFVFDKDRNPIDTMYYKKGDNYGRFFNIEPRLTFNYALTEKASLKTSYSRNVQNVHLISNSVSPFTSFEVWLPSSINIKPQISNQYTLGYYKSFARLGTTFTAESFYKQMNNQIDFSAHAETLLNPLLERELRFGSATAYGLELLAKKDEGRLRGWIGYTYARAKRKFADINQGIVYNASYDRPHQINFMLAYDINLRWNVGMNWNYATGSTYSSPISFYQYNGEEIPIYGQKNNARLPDYHRMDLSATFKLNKNPEKKYRHSISFSIFNVYGRKNILFVNYNKVEDNEGNFNIPSNLPDNNRITSQFYLFRFTPSFSYNFKFL
jgi:hypothetical protein